LVNSEKKLIRITKEVEAPPTPARVAKLLLKHRINVPITMENVIGHIV
jgi:hypothetical protein